MLFLALIRTTASLTCRVNKEWKDMKQDIDKKVDDPYLTADGEKAILNLIENEDNFQLCLNHAVRYTSYILWKDGVDKKERKRVLNAAILFTLTVLKQIKDGDKEAIKQRMEWVVDEMKKLYDIVIELSRSAAKFIRRASNSAVTFARVCYEGGRPWKNNLENG